MRPKDAGRADASWPPGLVFVRPSCKQPDGPPRCGPPSRPVIRVAVGLLLLGLSPGVLAEAVAGAPLALPAPLSEDQIRTGTARNLETARWMMDYDKVAWASTDLLLKESKETLQRVTSVWFCLQRDRVWYAVYGGLTGDAFEIAVCYRQAAPEKFEKVSPPDFPDANRFARAINLTLPEILDTTRRTTVRFNYYVRAEQERIAVYYVPGFQPDGRLAYGIQHTLFLDAAGQTVLAHDHYGRTLFGAVPGKDTWITLEMPECAYPTPQAIFAMMSYRDRFAGILTHCSGRYFGIALNDGEPTCAKVAPPPTSPGHAGL